MNSDNIFNVRPAIDVDLVRIASNESKIISRVGNDGIYRFCVDANDENAINFVQSVATVVNKSINGVSVSKYKNGFVDVKTVVDECVSELRNVCDIGVVDPIIRKILYKYLV